MSLRKMLIRFARKVVQNVLSQLTQQFNVVEQQAFNPMRAMVQSVTDGVWRGEGANAFVDEVSNLMIPSVGRVMDTINKTSANINHAVDTIDRADEQVNAKINSLADVFGSIY